MVENIKEIIRAQGLDYCKKVISMASRDSLETKDSFGNYGLERLGLGVDDDEVVVEVVERAMNPMATKNCWTGGAPPPPPPKQTSGGNGKIDTRRLKQLERGFSGVSGGKGLSSSVNGKSGGKRVKEVEMKVRGKGVKEVETPPPAPPKAPPPPLKVPPPPTLNAPPPPSLKASPPTPPTPPQPPKPPTEVEPAAPTMPPPPQVLVPWIATYDLGLSKYYFHNPQTGVTQWKYPQLTPPPPPPKGWTRIVNESGQEFFLNNVTGQTSFTIEGTEEAGGIVGGGGGDAGGGGGWVSATDANGNVYYINKETNETSWEKP